MVLQAAYLFIVGFCATYVALCVHHIRRDTLKIHEATNYIRQCINNMLIADAESSRVEPDDGYDS